VSRVPWVSTEALSPREAALNRLSAVMQAAAVLHAAALAGLLAFGLLRPEGAAWASALAGGFGSGAALFVLLGLSANIGAALLLAAALLAQENWTWLLALGAWVANAAALLMWGYWPSLGLLIPLSWVLAQMWRDRGAYHANPVTVKELRGRMRGVRAFAIVSVFVFLMGAFIVLLYVIILSELSGLSVVETGQVGRTLFRGVVAVELALIVLVVPALTSGAVSGERERQTYELLTTTLLPIPTFLMGKMVSALGYMALLVLAAVPLQSVSFLFGGISQVEIILSVAGLMATALLLGALGLFFSATTERTLAATVRVYIFTLVIVIGLPIVSNVLLGGAFANAVNGVGAAMPDVHREVSAIYADMLLTSLNPVATALATQSILVNQQALLTFDVRLATTGELLPVLAPWALLVVFYAAAAGGLLLAAVWRMRRRSA
jgi:ABC-2 type transport system permease protein